MWMKGMVFKSTRTPGLEHYMFALYTLIVYKTLVCSFKPHFEYKLFKIVVLMKSKLI